MNLLNTPRRRRAGALIASGAIGLFGAVAIAGPASAHAPSVSGTSSCINADGSWDVDWSVGNDYGLDATVTSAVATAGKATLTVKGDLVAPGQIIAQHSDNDPSKQTHGTTNVPGSAKSAKLTVVLLWSDGYTNNGQNRNGDPLSFRLTKPTEKCAPTTTPSTPTSTPPSSEPPVVTPSSSAPVETTSPTPTPTETTPDIPVPTPSTTDEAGEPDFKLTYYCDAMVFDVKNPANGIAFTLDFESSKGEKRHLDVKPGGTYSEKFSAEEGFKVKVTTTVVVEGKTYTDFGDVPFKKPADCKDNGGGLPVTGAAAGGIAGGAAVLLAAGAGLFVMARRRKIRFTA